MGGSELLMILAAAFLLFGPSKMPEIGRSVGRALRELQKARNEFLSHLSDEDLDLFDSSSEPRGRLRR